MRSRASLPALALLAGSVLFALSCGGEAIDFPHPRTLEEARADAAARGVPILIDFYTPG